MLELTTLGEDRATLNGLALRVPGGKGLELLVWLAWHGGGSRSQIVEDLWDGSAEARHGEHFKILVRRLRAAMQTRVPSLDNPLPSVNGRYQLDPSIEVRLDAVAFENLLKSDEDVVSVYRGAFLAKHESAWVLALRSKFEAGAVAAIRACADRHQRDDPQGALAALERLLEIDPYDVNAHRQAIELYLRLGQRGLAQRHFQDLDACLCEFGERADPAWFGEDAALVVPRLSPSAP